MYEVWATAMPKDGLHTLERIFRKNNRTWTDREVFQGAATVGNGQATLVRGFHEEEVASRLVQEITLYGGSAEVRQAPESS